MDLDWESRTLRTDDCLLLLFGLQHVLRIQSRLILPAGIFPTRQEVYKHRRFSLFLHGKNPPSSHLHVAGTNFLTLFEYDKRLMISTKLSQNSN